MSGDITSDIASAVIAVADHWRPFRPDEAGIRQRLEADGLPGVGMLILGLLGYAQWLRARGHQRYGWEIDGDQHNIREGLRAASDVLATDPPLADPIPASPRDPVGQAELVALGQSYYAVNRVCDEVCAVVEAADRSADGLPALVARTYVKALAAARLQATGAAYGASGPEHDAHWLLAFAGTARAQLTLTAGVEEARGDVGLRLRRALANDPMGANRALAERLPAAAAAAFPAWMRDLRDGTPSSLRYRISAYIEGEGDASAPDRADPVAHPVEFLGGIDPGLGEFEAREAARAILGALPPREAEVAVLVLRGLGNHAIAEHLGIEVGTVRSVRHRIKRKKAKLLAWAAS